MTVFCRYIPLHLIEEYYQQGWQISTFKNHHAKYSVFGVLERPAIRLNPC